MSIFPLIDQYLSRQLEIDLPSLTPGKMTIVESTRRLRCEQSYGFVHALWGLWMADGRAAISVLPGSGEDVREALAQVGQRLFPPEANLIRALSVAVNPALEKARLPPVKNGWETRLFACNAALVRRREAGECVRLCGERIPPAEGLRLPTHCFPEGIVYGIVEDDKVVSVAYAHHSGLLERRVADLGVETAEAYRGRGYAKTVVSAVTCHVTQAGGEGLYNCSPGNLASMATARSVGYEVYGRALVLAVNL